MIAFAAWAADQSRWLRKALIFTASIFAASATATAQTYQTYNLTYSGASFGNGAMITGVAQINTAALSLAIKNGYNSSLTGIPPGAAVPLFASLTLVETGGGVGNGTFTLVNFRSFIANSSGSSSTLDFTKQLVGQTLRNGNPYGAVAGGGDFNFFRDLASPTAPNGSSPFILQDGAGNSLKLISLIVAMAPSPNLLGLAQSQNQRAVANGLTSGLNNGVLNGAAGTLATAFNNTPAGAIPGVLDSLSGEGITAAQNVAYRSSALFTSSIVDQTVFYGAGAANSVTLTNAPPPLAYVATRAPNSPILTHDAIVPAERTWRAWTTGFGAGENVRGDAALGTAAQTNSVYGGTLGVDYQFASNYLAGVALGGTDGSFSVPGRTTFGSTTGGHAAFYTLANFGAFYGAGTTSLSYFGNKTTRNIASFGGLAGETERGNFGSREFRSRAEFGWHTGLYGATLTPFVALEIAQLRSNGFTEGALNGAGLLALNVQGQTGASVPGYVGARLARSFLLDNGMVFTPTVQAAYLHEFAPQRNLVAGLVNLPGSTFLVDGARASSNAAQVKAGAELTLTANLRAFATFDGEFSGVEQVYAGKGGLRYNW